MNKKLDVLHVNYQYDNEKYASLSKEELEKQLKGDVVAVLDEILKNNIYTSFIILGKSFGTVAMSTN